MTCRVLGIKFLAIVAHVSKSVQNTFRGVFVTFGPISVLKSDWISDGNLGLSQLSRRLQRVFHQHRNRHWAHSAGNGSDGGTSWCDFVISDITGETMAGFF